MYFVMCVSIGGEHQGSALWGEYSLIINLRKPRAVPNVALKSTTYRELDLMTMRFKVLLFKHVLIEFSLKYVFNFIKQNGDWFTFIFTKENDEAEIDPWEETDDYSTILKSVYNIWSRSDVRKACLSAQSKYIKNILFRSYMVFIVGVLKD